MSVQELLAKANNGDEKSCIELGSMYADGDGVEQNYEEAIRYYQMAASMGNKEAYKHLGWLYFDDKYFPSDYEISFKYMKKAADLGDSIAQTHIAQAYQYGIWGAPEEDRSLMKKYFEMALNNGEAHAFYTVGMNYLIGGGGYPEDVTKAAEYFRNAAERGSSKGQLEYALCFFNGTGVSKNMSECVKWLEKASDQGNTEAQWRLGIAYIEGIGTSKNLEKGISLVEIAAEKGEKEAIELLPEIKSVYMGSGINKQSVESNTGGCYIATAVYGSYDTPEVWTLRRFRDNILDQTWYGRLFIKSYYLISPLLVKKFGKSTWFINFWRKKLDFLVAKLQNKGIEQTFYEDKY